MDNAQILEKSFAKMGARLQVDTFPSSRNPSSFRVNVLRDKKGEFFHIGVDAGVDIRAVDIQPKDRHLLLHAADSSGKHKFLCGHDERQWFVAAVPPKGSVTNVRAAKEALKPAAVIQRQNKTKAKVGGRRSRRNAAYIRQGEWFFVPEQGINPKPVMILRNEPIQRGNGGKPHMCEMLFRSNGEQVYVDWKHPNGITEKEYKSLPEKARKRGNWRVMVRDADVYVKGRITHPDHATVVLREWCRVRQNRENEAPSMRHVAFLD